LTPPDENDPRFAHCGHCGEGDRKINPALLDGAAVEKKEHHKTQEEAEQTARDHLKERPDYYERLDELEKVPVGEHIKTAQQRRRWSYTIGQHHNVGVKDVKGTTVGSSAEEALVTIFLRAVAWWDYDTVLSDEQIAQAVKQAIKSG
jgi:hypothetical protein